MRDRIVVGVDGSDGARAPSSGPSRRHDCAAPHSWPFTPGKPRHSGWLAVHSTRLRHSTPS